MATRHLFNPNTYTYKGEKEELLESEQLSVRAYRGVDTVHYNELWDMVEKAEKKHLTARRSTRNKK